MIVRLVKMEFKEGTEDLFLKVFNESKNKIRGFEGCEKLILLRDKKQPSVFFTHSHWISEDHLNNYRNSDLFKETWAKTKIHFSQPAQAWSCEALENR